MHIATCDCVANAGEEELTALLDIDEWKHPVDQRLVVELSKVFRT